MTTKQTDLQIDVTGFSGSSSSGTRSRGSVDARWRRFLPVVAVLTVIIAGGLGRLVAQTPTEDKEQGEEEQIERRREWFFSTRRAGTESGKDPERLRQAGVLATRRALEAQRLRRTKEGLSSAQSSWISMGPSPSAHHSMVYGNVSGRVVSIAADRAGGALYVGTASGGLWKSTDDGLSWTALFDTAGTQTVGTVAVDPNDPNVIWVGTGENTSWCEQYFGIGLLRSGDGGLTWELRNGTVGGTLDDLSSFANVIIDPRDSNRIVTGGQIRGCSEGAPQNGGLYTSNDGGLTWAPHLTGKAIFEIARDPAVLDVLWAGTSEGVYKSVDNGVNWNLQTSSGLPHGSTSRTELAIAPSNGNSVYAFFQGPLPTFWRTTNGGVTWTQMSSLTCRQCGYNMVVRVDRTNPDIVYYGMVDPWKSVNGGANWDPANWAVHSDIQDLLMDPDDPDTFYVGCDGGVWKTADGGGSFINLNGNLNATQFYAIDVQADDPNVICGGAQDNDSLARTRTTGDLNVWDMQRQTGDGFVCQIDPQDANYAYVTSYGRGGYPQVMRSTTGLLGQFSIITGAGSGIHPDDRASWVTPYLLDPIRPHILYLGTYRVYRSADHGDSWTQVGPPDLTGGGGRLLSLEINPNFTNVLYSGSDNGKVWRTVNSGSDWVDITTGLPPNRTINDIASDPTDPDRAFAVVGGFNTAHLWEWTASAGWVERGIGLPNVPANTVLMLTASHILVGTDTGIFESLDGGVTFQPEMDGLPEGLVVTDLKYNMLQSVVTAGTYGRGAWQVSIEVGPMPPLVRYDSILPIVEVDGDGDGVVERGETWSVRPILRNRGGASALGVQARLATSTAGVTILTSGPRPYGDIAPGATSAVASAYTFALDPSQCSSEIAFDILDITSTTPGVYPDTPAAFTVRSACPLLQYDSFSDLTEIEGNGNGGIDPGETWELTVKLRNGGDEPAAGVTANLIPGPASAVSVTMLQAASTYANLAVGAAAPSERAYRFRVDSLAPCGEWISLGLVARSTDPQKTYPTEVGVIRLLVGGTGPAVTVFKDNFELPDTGWYVDPNDFAEWQIEIPRGLGGPIPDPNNGFEGPRVLGTDLTGLGVVPGNYETSTNWGSSVWSPDFDFTRYRRLSVSFARWLNVGAGDRATLEIYDWTSGNPFTTLYSSTDAADSSWTMNSFDISDIVAGSDDIQFLFSILSDQQGTASGWNIDAFEVRGVPIDSCEPYVPDTTPPSVAITSPIENANVSGTVNVTVNASDNAGVARVDLYRDGTLIGADPSSPYSISWNTTNETIGSHTLTAYAYDTSNLSTSSSPVHVNIPCNTVGATDLKVSKAAGGLLTWTAVAGATPFDVVRGGLSTLRSTNGNFQSATGLCIVNNTTNTTSTSSLNPSAGDGYWFLVRGGTCGGAGTYDDGTQVASRDAGINAAGNRSCP